MDGELPSPWKEKMESHFSQCPSCKSKYENYKRLQKMFKKDTTKERRTFVESTAIGSAEQPLSEQEVLSVAKDRVWRNLQSRRRFRQGAGIFQRRLSIPLPAAAAAAAVILVILAALWIRSGFSSQYGEPSARANFVLASEEEIPGIIPAAGMDGVLQYLGGDGTDIIIMRLPESKNFLRAGEPAIINASDYTTRRRP
jgi:anti-sigma factor RsiW